jgi:hypothetical protein
MSLLARGLVAERPPPRRHQPGQDRAGAPWIVVRIRWELTARLALIDASPSRVRLLSLVSRPIDIRGG